MTQDVAVATRAPAVAPADTDQFTPDDLTFRGPERPASSTPYDLRVLGNDVIFCDGQDHLDHFWFKLVEREDGEVYPSVKVVKLAMLRFLPQEARHDAGLVAKQRAALVGLYNSRARFDLVHLVAGIFDPPIGVVQCYGVATSEPTLEEAKEQADRGMAALEGVLSNYVQSHFEPPSVEISRWLMDSLMGMEHSLALIGHPDPRESARGGGRESPDEPGQAGNAGAMYTEQQNEMLFRAMATQREEFIWMLLAHRMDMDAISRMLAGIAAEASAWASRVNVTKGLSFGLSVPIMLSGGLGRSAGTGYGESQGQTSGRTVAASEGHAHTQGHAETQGHAVTDGESHSTSVAHSSGGSSGVTRSSSWSVSESQGTARGTADTQGTSESWGEAHTQGSSTSVGHTSSFSRSSTDVPQIESSSTSTTSVPEISSHSVSHNPEVTSEGGTDIPLHYTCTHASHPETTSHGASQSASDQVNLSVLGLAGKGWSSADALSTSKTDAYAVQSTTTGEPYSTNSHNTTPAHDTHGASTTPAHTVHSGSWSVTPAHTITSQSSGQTSSVSSTSSSAHTNSHSRGVSQAHTESQSESESQGKSTGGSVTTSSSSFSSTTHGESWGTMHSETSSWAKTDSEADTESHGTSKGAAWGASYATVLGRSLAASSSMGISGGVIPSVTATKSYSWVDDPAAQVTQLLRTQEEMLRKASIEGAYLTDVYVLTRTDRGQATAEAAVRQAFHGTQEVVTSVLTRRLTDAEQNYILLHASAFTPSTRTETIPGLLEGYKDSTLLTMDHLAAYTAPGLFEEGTAITTQERIPPFAFIPDLEGDVVLAHQFSTETGELTTTPVRLTQARHMHTAFIGDTGFGKTVAAERLCYETAVKWHQRNVVLDFGAGWRRLLNTSIDRDRIDVWQLQPGAVRPLRWNPLQIGKRIDPVRQLRATTELFANAGQMGPRQLGLMRKALRWVYTKNGILTSDRDVLEHNKWGKVQPGEPEVINAFRRAKGLPAAPSTSLRAGSVRVGASLKGLAPIDRQALAVHRSKRVDIGDWYRVLKGYEQGYEKTGNRASLMSLEGVLLRLDVFVMGEMALMYGKGEGTIAIEDLGLLGPADDPWGISILEGGAKMDAYAKVTLLGLIAWHLYNDALVRRDEMIGQKLPIMNIFWEEANKVLVGIDGTSGNDDRGSGSQTTELFQAMWRDGRKYGVFNHPMLQTVSEIPPGIFSSCNNLFLCQTKSTRDRDMAMAAAAKSEKGFTDEEHKRFISRMPTAMAVCKLGYGFKRWELEPMLTRPLIIDGVEPDNAELMAWFQKNGSHKKH